MVSCTPSDNELSSEDLKGASDFIGLTEIQTISSSKLRLTWDALASSDVEGYDIYDVTIVLNPILVKTVDAGTTSTILSGLGEGFLRKYRVRARTGNGKTDGNENDVYGIPYAGVLGSTVISSTAVQFNYSPTEDGEALLARAYCQIGASSTWELMTTVTDMGETTVQINGLVPNTSYTCRFNVVVDGKEDNNLSRVTFVALGQADHMVFLTEPGNGQAGELLSIQPVIQILDDNLNIVSGGPDATVLVTLTVAVTSPTGGSVRGTFAVNAVAGVADFTDLFIQEAGAKILTATKADTASLSFGTGVMTVDSSITTFNITAGVVSDALTAITIDPAGPLVANGTDTYLVTFNLKDEFGNPVPGIKPEFISNIPGDFISQPITNSDALGQTSGSLSTTVSDTNTAIPRVISISLPSGLSGVQIAAPFNPGPANKLTYTLQPTNSPAGILGMNEMRVAVQDLQGNIITTGVSSTASISLSINNNIGGATLSGTISKNAVAGIVVFDDLGIDITSNGYSLVASGGVLSPGYSNAFNITAGIPKVIDMVGPTETLSGACSAAITLQLQDFGGNPAKAITTTTVQLSGLGNAVLYSSASCGGSPLSTNVTFTPGTDTRVLYIESDKVEDLTIVGTDASTILVSSSYGILVTPSKMTLSIVGGAPLNVPAGACSTVLRISPLAEDGSPGQVYNPTTATVSGIIGSSAQIFSDAACTVLLDPSSVSLVMAAPPGEKTEIYLKDPVGESLLLNAVDPSGDIATTSIPQDVIVGPSNIDFTGPSTVVSGACSAVFTISLKDTMGTNTITSGNKTLTVAGLGSYPSGEFFTSPACGGSGSATTVIVPDGNAQATVYFRGYAAAVLSISLTDASGDLAASSAVGITVTPSALRITAPVGPVESLTSICTGPFDVETLDGLGSVSTVVLPVTANLSGGGDAALFYSDVDCTSEITSVLFTSGQSLKNFYFKGQYPASLTLLASDPGSVLTSDTQAWTITAGLGWFGTASKGFDGAGDMLPFRTGFSPVSARYDGFRGATQLAMDPTSQFLYVADYSSHKILKYDYSTTEYVGWMGRLYKENGIGSDGSNLVTPSPALCVSTNHGQILPGWCKGGRSYNGGGNERSKGAMYYPWGIAADSTYVYVTSYYGHMISRFDATTGEFDGYIGWINSIVPTADGTGASGCTGASTHSVTPGWCIGGRTEYHNTTQVGDGRLRYPRGLAFDAVYLYVASERAVLKYDKTTGAFAGWIGRVDTVSPTGGEPGCTIAAHDEVTPGWCIGGRYKVGNPNGTGFVSNARDVFVNGTDLYVLSAGYGGVINRYNVTTGAFIETLPNLNGTWTHPNQFAWDGTKFYVADDERILRVDDTGLMDSWMGKVANNAGMSGNPGCNSLLPNEDTPGWCLGGTHKPGLDETSFINTYGVVYDGTGSLLVTSQDMPSIKKFNVATGVYEGSIGLESASPDRWVANYTEKAEYEGFDDNSLYSPYGSVIVGDFLFVAEYGNSRIKKMNKKTGEVLGWLGGMTSTPTGGEVAACAIANPMSPAPGWCLGASPYPTWTWNDNNMIDDLTDGIMRNIWGLTSDGTWIYAVDHNLHRVQRFNVITGVYGGWIGRISVSPTGGDPGCNGAAVNSFTPGWCLGGISKSGNGDGHLRQPTSIYYQSGNLYVIDAYNHRVMSYAAVTGGFNGWIGRIGSAPSSGCSPATNGDYSVSASGWCLGGTSSRANYRNDKGGGFNFDYSYRSGIFSDGIHLYITNTRNIRIDKFTLAGSFVEATRTREDQYTNSWKTSAADVAGVGNGINCSYPTSVWGDSTYIYGIGTYPCSRTGDTFSVWKMDKATGQIIGWKGGVDAAYQPTGGDAGCSGATGYTPGWCTGGRVSVGLKLGQFSGPSGSMTGDGSFLYISDREGNRVIRVPK